MLNKLKEVVLLVNMPLWAVLLFFLVIVCAVLKTIQFMTSRTVKKNNLSPIPSKEKHSAVKTLKRKKKVKKQRSIDLSANQKEASVHEVSAIAQKSIVQPSAPSSFESSDIKQTNSKSEKKKGKSKKKKGQSEEKSVLAIPNEAQNLLEEDGEWQTVRSKEQKASRRDKKRQESQEVQEAQSNISKSNPSISLPSTFNAISSMAKDIAPRFARAAGEEWQEGSNKRQVAANIPKPNPPVVTRTPMVPASVIPSSRPWPSNEKDLWKNETSVPVTSYTTAPWAQMTSNKTDGTAWSQNLTSQTWQTKPTSTSPPWEGTERTSYVVNVSPREGKPLKLLQFGDISPSSVTGNDQFVFGAPYSRGSGSAEPIPDSFHVYGSELTCTGPRDALPSIMAYSGEHLWNSSVESPSKWPCDPKSDDWVHVTAPSPTRTHSNEPWTTGYTTGLTDWSGPPGAVPQERTKRESFHLEPEGHSVSSLDPEDPWNIDSFEKQGDWSPPEASWGNNVEEWKAPTFVSKPQPTYFEESSDDEKPSIIPSSATATVSQKVVGAGSEFLATQNQVPNKKPRRRRRKKQATDNISEVVVKQDIVPPPVVSPDPTELKDAGMPEATEEANNEEAWMVSKPSKKKKPRVRKDE